MADFHDLKRDLKKLRGELELKMHLASMEVKEEWNELEAKWEDFSNRAGLQESGESLGEAFDLLGDEIKSGYKRLKAAIKD